MIKRGCFGSKQFSEISGICKACVTNAPCKNEMHRNKVINYCEKYGDANWDINPEIKDDLCGKLEISEKRLERILVSVKKQRNN
jgi:hypothetical protein